MTTIKPLSAVAPAAAPVAGEELTRLLNGGVAEARIVAMAQGGLLRILLDSLPTALSAPADAAFAAGDKIALKRGEGATSGLEIVRLQSGEIATPALFERGQGRALPAVFTALTPPRDGASSAGDRITTDPARDTRSPLSDAAQRPQPPANPLAEARQALLPMARAAMVGQQPLPELFRDVAAALAQPAHAWPLQLRAALQAVANHSFDPDATDAAPMLRRAVEGAGVFHVAEAVRGSAQLQGGGDLKGALLALRSLLGTFVETSARAPAGDAASAALKSTLEAAQALSSPAAIAQPQQPDEALQVLRHAIAAAQALARGDVGPAAQEPAPATIVRGDAAQPPSALPLAASAPTAAALAADEALAAATVTRLAHAVAAPLPPGADRPLPEAELRSHQAAVGRAAEPHDAAAARPPLRGELPPLHRASVGELETIEPRAQATQLLREVDGALDRLRLLQFASLDDRVAVELARDPAASATRQWQVEIPLALQQQAAALPLMIERDGGGAQGGGREDATWRMRFTTETAELGAIDVAVSLRNGRLDVRFWADRPETSALIDGARSDLATRIENAAAPVDAIRCQLGRRAAPRSALAKPGQFMDFRS